MLVVIKSKGFVEAFANCLWHFKWLSSILKWDYLHNLWLLITNFLTFKTISSIPFKFKVHYILMLSLNWIKLHWLNAVQDYTSKILFSFVVFCFTTICVNVVMSISILLYFDQIFFCDVDEINVKNFFEYYF
jgi:hypothetical protein